MSIGRIYKEGSVMLAENHLKDLRADREVWAKRMRKLEEYDDFYECDKEDHAEIDFNEEVELILRTAVKELGDLVAERRQAIDFPVSWGESNKKEQA